MLMKRRREITEVDLTPMIDVVFQLIIFFMVALTIAVVYGIVIKFPQSSRPNKNKGKQEKILSVYINQDWIGADHKVIQDGDIKVLGETVQLWVTQDPKTRKADRDKAWDYIQKKMDYLIRGKGFKTDMMVIKGDVKTYHWKVIKIIDIGKELGVKGFSLAPPYK